MVATLRRHGSGGRPGRRGGRRFLAAAVAALVLAGGTLLPVAASAAPEPGPGLEAAAMPPFYTPPEILPPGPPGTIVREEDATSAGLHGTARLVMYKSESIQGDEIPVTGLILVPSTPPPPGGYPVVAWAHGTTGIADECAPSLDGPLSVWAANELLDRGYVVTATDYEGLGTPGRHPYIVGESEARGVIDSVRAARALLGESTVSPDYAVWGISQGGHASMFSLHIAESWAPELNLTGVVAAAPPSQFDLIYQFLVTSPYRFYLIMVAAGINAAYGDVEAPLPEVLNAAGIAKIGLVDEGCGDYLYEQASGIEVNSLMVQQADGTYNPVSNPIWGPLVRAQDPGGFKSGASAPLLIVHGGADEQIPTVSSEMLAGQLCSVGQGLERWVYPDQSHAGVLWPSEADTLEWLDNRFAGVAAPDPMYPTGQADAQASVCVAGKMVTRTSPAQTPPAATPATPAAATPSFTG